MPLVRQWRIESGMRRGSRKPQMGPERPREYDIVLDLPRGHVEHAGPSRGARGDHRFTVSTNAIEPLKFMRCLPFSIYLRQQRELKDALGAAVEYDMNGDFE